MTKHLLLAAALVVLSLITLALGLGASSAAGADGTGEPAKPSLGGYVLPASRATDPLVREFAGDAATNPFTLKPAGEAHQTRLPFPPPPALDLPPLPVLPIPER